MIPKKIHYIWLGRKPKSLVAQMCINSWRRNLKDYEIVEWNEETLGLDELCRNNKFLNRLVKVKLWGVASDYLRFHILYHEGGIYLDTDVEVIRPYDDFLSDKIFVGRECDTYVTPATLGAEKNNLAMKRLLEFYDNDVWNLKIFTGPQVLTHVMEKHPEEFADCKVYEREFFQPYIPSKQYDELVEGKNTYSIHWFSNDWNMSRKACVFLNTRYFKNPVIKLLMIVKRNIGYFRRTVSGKPRGRNNGK